MSVAAFIACHPTEYGVPHAVACRALGVSQSWFYKWHNRPPTVRHVRRAELADKIRELFNASGGTTAHRASRRICGRPAIGSAVRVKIFEAGFSGIH